MRKICRGGLLFIRLFVCLFISSFVFCLLVGWLVYLFVRLFVRLFVSLSLYLLNAAILTANFVRGLFQTIINHKRALPGGEGYVNFTAVGIFCAGNTSFNRYVCIFDVFVIEKTKQGTLGE